VNRRDSLPPRPEDGRRAAQEILDRVMFDLGGVLAAEGLHSEETIRMAGFFESAKSLWLETGSPSDPMTSAMFVNRLRVLTDICPPELSELGDRLARALKMMEDSVQQQKRA
jgi:hypothetical protein